MASSESGRSGSSDALTPKLDASAITTFSLAIISVVLRILCRKATKAGLWWDDWFAFIAAIPCIASFLLLVTVLRSAAGHHITDISPDLLPPYFKAFYAAQLIYVFSIAFVKFSILFFYWRLFSVSGRLPILVMFGIIIVYNIVLFFFLAFQCHPVSQAWEHTDPDACFDLKQLFIGGSTPNIVTDVILMLMPIPYLYRLHIRLLQRILLGGVFIIGGFVAIVSIIRITVLAQQDLSNPDVTYYLTDVLMWTMVEINVGLLCCNLPSLKPVLTFVRTGSFYGSTNPSDGGSYGPHSAGHRSKGIRGSQRLFSTTKSGHGMSREEDEQGFVRITEEEREMGRGVGVNSQAWGKSSAGVEVNMDDLSGRKDSRAEGISVTRDWTVKYDGEASSSPASTTNDRSLSAH